MEEEEAEEKSSNNSISKSSISSATNSRWSPTKEQIIVLESLYKEGIRTPSGDQIQQIAVILKEYGTIEGKNVFYWFQNHKARQRQKQKQKQKQETIACFNRLLRRAASVAPPSLLPHHHRHPVGCSPYYFPHATIASIGYYPHCSNVLLPGVIPQRSEEYCHPRGNERVKCIAPKPQYPCGTSKNISVSSSKEEMNTHETLQLFPLHPTGFLEERSGYNYVDSNAKEEEDDDGVVEMKILLDLMSS